MGQSITLKACNPSLTYDSGAELYDSISAALLVGTKVTISFTSIYMVSPSFFIGLLRAMGKEQLRLLYVLDLEELPRKILQHVLQELIESGQCFFQVVDANGRNHPVLLDDGVFRVYTEHGYAEWPTTTLVAREVEPEIYDRLLITNYNKKLLCD